MADTFGKLLLTARVRRWLTQAEVGVLVGRTANTIARWERGELRPGALVMSSALSIVRRQALKRGRIWILVTRAGEGSLQRSGRVDFRTRADAETFLLAHKHEYVDAFVSKRPTPAPAAAS